MVQNKNARGSRPIGSQVCSFSQTASDLEPMLAPALRRLPGWRSCGTHWVGHGRTVNGNGARGPPTERARRKKLAEDPRTVGEKPAELANRLRQRPGYSRRRVGRGWGESAGADGRCPRLRPPGGLASLPPQPLAWPAAPTHRPGPCPWAGPAGPASAPGRTWWPAGAAGTAATGPLKAAAAAMTKDGRVGLEPTRLLPVAGERREEVRQL